MIIRQRYALPSDCRSTEADGFDPSALQRTV